MARSNFCYQREHVVACTIITVMCSVFVLGGLTKPVLNLCGIPMGADALASAGTSSTGAFASPARSASSGRLSKQWWKRKVVSLDRTVLRPVLVVNQHNDPQPAATPATPPAPALGPAHEAHDERL